MGIYTRRPRTKDLPTQKNDDKPIKCTDLSPMARAIRMLGPRLHIRNGSYWLDGRPTGLHEIMKVTGIELKRDGGL